MAGFFYPGEQPVTPESIAAKRALIAQLQPGNLSAAPVGHWTQALARVMGSAADGYQSANLDATEKKSTDENKAMLLAALGGGSPQVPAAATPAPVAPSVSRETPAALAATPAGVQPSSAPTGQQADGNIGQRLAADLQRDFGLSPHQAAGFAGNLAHESGGFKSLQEINPLVPGSRGGFGYAQWTGPRRVAFEQFAKENNLDPKTYEANYGFLKHELSNTSEGRVIPALKQAGDIGQATRIVSDQFLRPGIPHMNSRMQYAQTLANSTGAALPGGGTTNSQPLNVQQASGMQNPQTQALLAALSSPWAQKNPMLAQIASASLTKQFTRDPIDEQLKRIQLQQAQRDLQDSKPFTIKIDGEDVSVVRDAQGNMRRVQLAGEPSGGQPKTFKMPDGREIQLPTDPIARKKMLEEFGTAGAKAVEGAPSAITTAQQSINVIDKLIGSEDGKIKPHAGLPNLFGIYGKLPTRPGGDTADAESIIAQIKDRSFLEGIAAMRGTGAITEAEGAKATGAIARLSTNQSPKAFNESLKELRGILGTAMTRNQTIANNGRPATGAAPAATQGNQPVVVDGWKIERI